MWNQLSPVIRWGSSADGDESQDPRRNHGCFGHLRNILMRYRKLLASLSTLLLSRHETVLFLSSFLYFIMIASAPVEATIDCFKCSSRNGDNPSCEDPFHNNYSTATLESPCMGGRKGRNGLFLATACLKLNGVFENGDTIIVRGCALDSGTLNTDTEIIRMSHCGHFYFDEKYVKGCLQSCEDSDGCNLSTRPMSTFLHLLLPIHLLIALHFVQFYHHTFL